MNAEFTRRLSEHPLVAILRARSANALDSSIDTLVEAGVTTLEITLPTPGAADAIAGARSRYPQALIGAGTVLSREGVELARDAGAQFLVCPDTDDAVLAAAGRVGLPILPGAFSPTEILRAWKGGAAAVKVFPARSLGASFVSDLRGPLPEIPLVAVGGIGLNDVAAYLGAGAVAVGIGSPLLGDALDGGSQEQLAERARAFVDQARGER